MKLTRPKLVETLRKLNEGWTVYQARKIAGISLGRVYQVWNAYRRTGKIPKIGHQLGRPKKPITKEELHIVRTAYRKYRVCAASLEKLIELDYGVHIPHNTAHEILMQLDLAQSRGKKDMRKKTWIRYERRHSLTAVHLDWFEYAGMCALPVIDDASRKLLALVETAHATTEASIAGMQEALQHGQILQCISDHGSQFIDNKGGENKFKAFLEKQSIKQILCRIKHPQSNGKVEKFGDLYKTHRKAFKTREAFIHWYNNIRPHRSLNFDQLETPEQAYQRKKKQGRRYYT